jgi:hypothetical protein
MGANTSDADFLRGLGRGRGSQLFNKKAPNAAGATVWKDFFFDGGITAVTGVVAASQAQTILADGSFAASSGVTGDAATSQAQTVAASGTASPLSVSGVLTTSQAQTIASSGAASVASVSGTIATSQAQTISASGSAIVAAVSGSISTSQAQTIGASGSTGSGVSGVGATSQAQMTVADGLVSSSNSTDTHDGFWRKQWEDIAKKSKAAHKLEKKRQKEAEIALAKTEALVSKAKESKPIESPIVLSESATYVKNNKLIVDRVIESTYHADNEDEDLLMLW